MAVDAADRVATDPRISRRRRAVARSKRRRWVTAAAVVVGTGIMGWAALASPLLAVRHVKVVGARHTSSTDVARVAGLGPSDNLLMVSPAEVEVLAETLPWVKRADAERVLPGTVRVRIVERKPAMVVSLGAARWTVDARGNVLDSGVAVRSLPVLAVAEIDEIDVGIRLSAPEIEAALRAFRSLDRRLRRQVAAVVAPSAERISFSLDDGTLIRFGSAERLRAKNEVLTALLRRLDNQNRTVSYIDVRVPTSPAVAAPLAPVPDG